MTDLRGWPQSLIEIAQMTSVATALKLVDAFGGLKCYIPQLLTDDHPLVRGIGREAAHVLHEQFRGDYIQVPVLAVPRPRKRLLLQAAGGTKELARQSVGKGRYGLMGTKYRAP